MMDQYADIEGPLRIGWFGILPLIFLVGLMLLIALVVVWRHRRRKTIDPATVAQRSPLELALERLERLRLEAAGLEADPFVVEVSDVVRDYLESALKIPAREQTSEEFLQALQSAGGLPGVLRASMPPFLTQCDLVKFARQHLEEDKRTGLLETAGDVIRETDRELSRVPNAEAMEGVAS